MSTTKPSFPEEDWPWIWAIEDRDNLDWTTEFKNDADGLRAKEEEQKNLPVLISSPPDNPCFVFLSNMETAFDFERLSSLGITHVINVAGEVMEGEQEQYTKANIKRTTIEAEDEEGYPVLKEHWEEFQNFVKSAPAGSNILVHCVAGINRSAVFVAAHKLVSEQKNVLDVVAHLRRQRGNWALHNGSFIDQLVAFARTNGLLGPRPGEPCCRVAEKAPPYDSFRRY
ncbi:specificity phosphatase DUPD1 [Seminavis robusta]|uniref:protein-serine/threonine phosphatase n=1 Tax=Seminavis robusta TaxID=568900 RepID=A0A9N8EWM0_9STRA|nr:specificity phosphatase DUPD1 [Seminavis robusta]|eukprot:Sro2268_g321310.1 specificity phosphatase DUPD1 (227) ;mRNA; f:7849-8529